MDAEDLCGSASPSSSPAPSTPTSAYCSIPSDSSPSAASLGDALDAACDEQLETEPNASQDSDDRLLDSLALASSEDAALHDGCEPVPSGELEEVGCGGERVASGEENGGVALGEAEDAVPKELADVPLAIIIMQMLLSLSTRTKSTITKRLHKVRAFMNDGCMPGFLVTTACSGTDLIIPTLSLFFRLAVLMLGAGLGAIEVEHMWSCEWTPYKAQWIGEVLGAETIFKNVLDICKNKAAVHLSALHQDGFAFVSGGTLFASGFSCKSVSALNMFRQHFQNAIQKNRGSTG